jgi:NAD(P)-dependent dehydrogenase (short-subunit alcohol dehydrogenase family)
MKANGGVILNMASIASSIGLPDRFAYSMSKGAVLTMTLSVAKDYIKNNIRCNCISPARVHTPFVDGFIAKITRVVKNVRETFSYSANWSYGKT